MLEIALHGFGALVGAGVTAIVLPASNLATFWGLLIFPAIFFSGAMAWAFVLFTVMGMDVFRRWLFRRGEHRGKWLPENTVSKPGSFMFVVMGLLIAALMLILIRTEVNTRQTQTITWVYLAMGAFFGVVLWLLGRRGIIAPLSPLLQWLIGDDT